MNKVIKRIVNNKTLLEIKSLLLMFDLLTKNYLIKIYLFIFLINYKYTVKKVILKENLYKNYSITFS